MSDLNIKLADLQISDFHALECCFLWWHTEKTFSLWGRSPQTPTRGFVPGPHWGPAAAPRPPHHFPPFSLLPSPMSGNEKFRKDGKEIWTLPPITHTPPPPPQLPAPQEKEKKCLKFWVWSKVDTPHHAVFFSREEEWWGGPDTWFPNQPDERQRPQPTLIYGADSYPAGHFCCCCPSQHVGWPHQQQPTTQFQHLQSCPHGLVQLS